MKIIAMIPARMGSKRIPKKNIRLLAGKPLLQYAIENAVNSGAFDEVWVNSESEVIGELAKCCGVGFHKRPAELSGERATNNDFTREFLECHECDYLVMVNPTSPLIFPETVADFVSFVRDGKYDTVLSVVEEYAECFFCGKPINFSVDRKVNSQDLVPVVKVVWALTAWKRETFLRYASLGKCATFSGELGFFPIPFDQAVDIDTEAQWKLAEEILLARKIDSEETEYWGEK